MVNLRAHWALASYLLGEGGREAKSVSLKSLAKALVLYRIVVASPPRFSRPTALNEV